MKHAWLVGPLAFAISGCGEIPDEPEAQVADGNIECALNGAAWFESVCQMERAERDGERLLVVWHPDGAFRRFQLGVPGRGLRRHAVRRPTD